jgi:hypothetical protein
MPIVEHEHEHELMAYGLWLMAYYLLGGVVARVVSSLGVSWRV